MTRTVAVHRSIVLLGLAALAGFLLLDPQTAEAAQICGCKKISTGKVKKLVSPGPVTCNSSYTPICWNDTTEPTVSCQVRDFTVVGNNGVSSCEADEFVSGGGCSPSPGGTLLRETTPILGPPQGWHCVSESGVGVTIVVHAICCK